LVRIFAGIRLFFIKVFWMWQINLFAAIPYAPLDVEEED
jgi:hypothetical protein